MPRQPSAPKPAQHDKPEVLVSPPAGIDTADDSLWTANEVRILRDLAKHHASLAMLAYHIGRTEEDIAQKAASINLPLIPMAKSNRIFRKRIT